MTSKNSKFGIINYSNNCYLNVIIQLFLYNKYTSNIIIHHLDITNLVNSKDKDNVKVINPKKLMRLLSQKINVNRQNDSQETFTLILDLIPELEKYYENKIKNSYTCQICNKKRIVEDTFSTFYIYDSSLEDSVKNLVKKEQFQLECENCKKNTTTTKSCKITKLGNILIFFNVLKNKLSLSETIIFGETKYKLTGIIKHHGTQNFGHYIFIDFIEKLIIDDTTITKLENLTYDNIYLVFYTIE